MKSYSALLTNPSYHRNTHLISLLIPFHLSDSVSTSLTSQTVRRRMSGRIDVLVSRDRFFFVLFGHPRSSFRFRAQIYQRHSESVTDPNFNRVLRLSPVPSSASAFETECPDSARTFEGFAVETFFFNGRINVLCNRHSAG